MFNSTVKANLLIAREQQGVGKRWCEIGIIDLSIACNNTWQFQSGPDAILVITTANGVNCLSNTPDNLLFYNKSSGFLPA